MFRKLASALVVALSATAFSGLQAQPPVKDKESKALSADTAKKILLDKDLRTLLQPFVGSKDAKTPYTFRHDNLKDALQSDAAFKRLLEPALADWLRANNKVGKADEVIRAWEQAAKEKQTTLFDVFRANAGFQIEGEDGPKDRFLDSKEALAIHEAEAAKARGNRNNFIIARMKEKGKGAPPDPVVIK